MNTKQPDSLFGELSSSFSGLPLWKRLSTIAIFLLVVSIFYHMLGWSDSLVHMIGPFGIIVLALVSTAVFGILCLFVDFILENFRYEQECERERD